jgi:serine protease
MARTGWRASLLVVLSLGACSGDPTNPLLEAGVDAPRLNVGSTNPSAIELKLREPETIGDFNALGRADQSGGRSTIAPVLNRLGSFEIEPLIQINQPASRSPSMANAPLSTWYRVILPAGTDVALAIAELQAMPEVEYAYPAPEPAPPPGFFLSNTPLFSFRQRYFQDPPEGTAAEWAGSQPGAGGEGIMVVDLEYSWVYEHEDLGFTSSILLAGEPYYGFGDSHGTAVLGVLAARDNGFGVTGGVPDAEIRVVAPFFGGWYNPANAIVAATVQMSAGDVLLIEQQYWGPNGLYVPLEWLRSVYDATRFATDRGIVVVAAAGNGGENLDGPEFLGRFDRSRYNSGAIIVGAGTMRRERLAFSSYGSRVDLHGWGLGVTTTGYGDLFGTNRLNFYTAAFSGTSSASPIAASAVAAVQGYRKATNRPVLTPAEVADLLRRTGVPQAGNTNQPIGPFPNLRAALEELGAGNRAPTAVPGGPYTGKEGSPITFNGGDSFNPDGDKLMYSWDFGDESSGTGETPSHTYPDDGTYTVTLRVEDSSGATSTATTTSIIHNLAPAVSAAGPTGPISPAASGRLTVSFNDPAGSLDAPFTAVIDCGNGTGPESLGVVSSPFEHACRYDRAGRNTVAIAVTDKDGGIGSAALELIVAYRFSGFRSPVVDLQGWTNRNAGSNAPLKFSLGGDFGLGILSAGSPRSREIDCNNAAPRGEWAPTSTPGNSNLGFDRGEYQINWKTQKEWRGTCRELSLLLDDGTEHTARFRFRP